MGLIVALVVSHLTLLLLNDSMISALSLSLILRQRLKAFLFSAFFPDIVIDNPSLLAHHLWILT